MYAARHADETPLKPAIIMAASGVTLTYGEYERRANQMAQLFREAGLRRTDHIAIFMANEPEMLVAEGAAERSGLYYTCINTYLSAEEVAYIVNDCAARVLVASGALADVTVELPPLCPSVERWLMAGAGRAAEAPWEDLEEVASQYPSERIGDEWMGTAMLYSSGTTGRPKGILRPLPAIEPGATVSLNEGLSRLWRFREEMVYLSPAPLYHSAPQTSVALSLRLGATVVVMEHFDPAEWLRLVERHRVTHCQMVPTMFSRLLKLPVEVRDAADLSSIETIIHAAAPCPVPVKEQMIEWLGPVLVEYYAATEANGFTCIDSEEWTGHKGSVGRALVGEVLILDADGRPCPARASGPVWFKGATNFEYFNDPAATARSRNEAGDSSTVGDIGYLDDEGYLFLTDRESFVIISGGVNIYPQETENLLVGHPKVVDAAVIGVPDEEMGETVKAVVELVEGLEAGPELEAELIAYCREHLAHFKCPRSIDFVAELPRLPTGKLYKRLLRDRYWEGHATRLL
jgi:acyl-CoA synthetase (AMP-forming)/AMP-acid ligase II